MSRRPAAALAVLAAALTFAAPVSGTNPVRAQTAGGPPSLALAGAPAWVAIGSSLDLDVAITGDAASLELFVSVRSRLESRTAFDRTLDGEGLRGTVASVTLPAATLATGVAGAAGTHRASVFIGEPPPPPTPSPDEPTPRTTTTTTPAPPPLPSLAVTQEGVYPLVIELRPSGSEEAHDRLVTYVVALDPAAQRTPLSVAWVWPMAVDAPRLPDGSVGAGLGNAVAPSGRIGQMVAALAGFPDLPVTLAPRGAALDAWAELAAGATAAAPGSTTTDPATLAATSLAALQAQAALQTRQFLAGTYARVDLPALARGGLAGEIAAQLAEGADVLRATLGIRPDPRTFLVSGGLEERSLSVLRQAGVDRLVIPRSSLEPVFEQLTPARPFDIETRGRPFRSASPDPLISGILGPPEGDEIPSDAETAQRFLAGLAVVALEAPSSERGVVVVPPLTWTPPTTMLTLALRGLSSHPALSPVTLDSLFSGVDVADDDTAQRDLEPSGARRLALSREAIEGARARIASLATMLEPTATEPALAARRLLLAQAEPFQRRGADPDAIDYLAGVDGVIGSVIGSVRLPDAPSVTLTAQRGAIPLTLVNDSGRPLRVRLSLTSDKLLFPGGATHDLVLPPRSTTERFTVEARTSGSFPMVVEVTSPDGNLAIGSFEMTIRSTAVSGVALTVTIGAGLFLAGWWGNHFRKSRRARREDDEADRAG
ncbi:MAG TPA: DUF6049 family protein [Acidimicrobiia bacterium]|nr:DUF6049 family protein [Acidimicrobiia bacterium]